jgi:hypothetical protein
MITKRRAIVRSVLIAMTISPGLALPSHAENGSVSVVFSKAALVAGIGGGNGVLTFRGKRYPFNVTGASLGASLGISTNKLNGYVLNLSRPEDFAGGFSAIGAGGAVAAGVSSVRLRNANGVVLVLRGAKFGVEMSANIAHVNITMR